MLFLTKGLCWPSVEDEVESKSKGKRLVLSGLENGIEF